jgi:hypothetical protein
MLKGNVMLKILGTKPSDFDGVIDLVSEALGMPAHQIALASSVKRAEGPKNAELHFRFTDDSRLDHHFVFSENKMSISSTQPSRRNQSHEIHTSWDAYLDFLLCRRSKEQLFMEGDWGFSHGRTGTFDFFELSLGIQELERRLPIPAWVDMESAIRVVGAASLRLGSFDSIERVSNLSPKDFFARYASLGRPVVLSDTFVRWPTQQFSFDMLLGIYERRSLIYDAGLGTMFSLPVNDYIERVARNDSVPQKLEIPLTREFLKHYRYPQYFTPKSFFQKAQSLIVAPEDAFVKRGYGNATCWHCDLADNFLVQLIGQKRVQLAPPHNNDCFYVAKKEPRHDNVGFFHSPLDPKEPDIKKYPRFADVTVVECVLGPGDTLFIPFGWFHNVDNLAPSVAVNSWKIAPCAEVAPELGATDGSMH